MELCSGYQSLTHALWIANVAIECIYFVFYCLNRSSSSRLL